MKPEIKQYTAMVGGKPLTFEVGKLAGQAGGAVTVQIGESQIFGVVTMSKTPREGIDFFPLSVDYEERMYAGGRVANFRPVVARQVIAQFSRGGDTVFVTAGAECSGFNPAGEAFELKGLPSVGGGGEQILEVSGGGELVVGGAKGLDF